MPKGEFCFCPLASGSGGNAIYLGYQSTRILIDCGKSGKTIESGLASIGVDPRSLSFILLTHSHDDHIRGAGVMSRRYHLPIYATQGTWTDIFELRSIGKLDKENIRVLRTTDPAIEGLPPGLEITPFAIPHDARDPVGYHFRCGDRTAVIATDLGYASLGVKAAALGAELVLLESNHDLDMLKNGSYPAPLKRRILGNNGHLSNLAAGRFAAELAKSGTKRIYLGHLSKENNRPHIALTAVREVLTRENIDPDRDIEIVLTDRDNPAPMTVW